MQAFWVCSVRFGVVAGRLRLLVACQNGLVYVFEVGPGPLDSAPAGLPCHSLQSGPEIASHPEQREVSGLSLPLQLSATTWLIASGMPQ